MPENNKLRNKIEKAIIELLDQKEPNPEANRVKLGVINAGIKWEAVKNKIDEAEWGNDIDKLGRAEGTDDDDE